MCCVVVGPLKIMKITNKNNYNNKNEDKVFDLLNNG